MARVTPPTLSLPNEMTGRRFQLRPVVAIWHGSAVSPSQRGPGITIPCRPKAHTQENPLPKTPSQQPTARCEEPP